MMNFTPKAQGMVLDTDPSSFGELECSARHLREPEVLRERMEQNGYLFMRDFFRREDVLAPRREALLKMEGLGYLEPGTDPLLAMVRKGEQVKFLPELGEDNEPLHDLLYSGRIMEFYRAFFGEDVLHFNYTWFRAVGPGPGTNPHCDVVYMGRGTRDRLFTAWVPMGDVTMQVGGLMILEGSHRQQERLRTYLERDVDDYCTNRPEAADIESGKVLWTWNGSLSNNPVSLREKLGGRWLTTAFQAGDLLTFPMHTVHASLDNQSEFVRLSSDSRYQPASQPADERWVGENPIGHSLAGKRGRIC